MTMTNTTFATSKAMDALKDSMVQMRHEAVDEIKDGMRQYIHDLTHDLLENFTIVHKWTGRQMEREGLNLTKLLSDSEWYKHEILELLKRNEDDALEQTAWIVEPDSAPEGCAPEHRFGVFQHGSIPLMRGLGDRDQHLRIVEELGKTLLGQECILREAFGYLQAAPDVYSAETALQATMATAKVRNLLQFDWMRQTQKARELYRMFMGGRGACVGEEDLGTL